MVRRLLFVIVLLGALIAVAPSGGPAEAATTPGAPTDVTTRPSDARATVSWTPPVDTGGEVIGGYTATSNPGNLTCTTVTTSCVITGLTNGTPYSFTVAATNSAGTSVASAASAPATPLAGTEGFNFIVDDNTRIRWHQDHVGATGTATTWPGMIYNSGNATANLALGATLTAAAVHDSVNYPVNGCGTAWHWYHILCDPESPVGSAIQARHHPSYVRKLSSHAGFTINSSSAAIEGYVVVDLGQVRTFTTMRVFQMFSDGKVTEMSIAMHPETGATFPSHNAAGWTEVNRQGIGAGRNLGTVDGQALVSCPTIMDFGATQSRYVKLTAKNSGEFGFITWIEVGAVKLFFENAEPSGGEGCPPEPPRALNAVAGNTTASLSWIPGDNLATSYIVQYRVSPSGSWISAATQPNPLPGTSTTAVVTGLTNGTPYQFRVAARNGVGTSPYSANSTTVTPVGTLAATPTSLTATPLTGGIRLSWNTVAGVASYRVTGSPTGACTTTAPAVTCDVMSLVHGIFYTFSVAASSDGTTWSPESSASAPATPLAGPQPPTQVMAVPFDSAATVSWRAPTHAVDSYTATADPGGAVCTTATTSCTITGLSNGTSYTFTVSASTSALPSALVSEPSEPVRVATVPSPPLNPQAVGGLGQAEVSWDSPVSNGGAPITTYTVTTVPGGATCTTAGTSCTVTGLANGTAYTFTVTAANASGPSPASLATPSLIVGEPAAAPVLLQASPCASGVRLFFDAPTNTGGTPVTAYQYRIDNRPWATATTLTSPIEVAPLKSETTFDVELRATLRWVKGPPRPPRRSPPWNDPAHHQH